MKLTTGIEEEFFISRNNEPIDLTMESMAPFNITRESHKGVIEIVSPILKKVDDAIEHLDASRAKIRHESEKIGATVFSGGTHPFIGWQDVSLHQDPVHQKLSDTYQICSHSTFTFGMHIHFGGIDHDLVPYVFNGLRRFIPLFISFSANSRLWGGVDTGLSCYRLVQLGIKPRSGLPDKMTSIKDTERQINNMLTTGCLDKPTSIWEDVRWHPLHKTLEVRVFDTQQSSNLATLTYILTYSIVKLLCINPDILKEALPEEKWILSENRWRSIRYGRKAVFITSKKTSIEPVIILEEIKRLLVGIGENFLAKELQKVIFHYD
tara:strand:+ start:1682 stop:2647 length:966 start_codon:yes stop_codon:yes gene_type:complete